MAYTIGQAKLKTKYPVVTGLGADDKHEGRVMNLVPTIGSLVPRRNRIRL